MVPESVLAPHEPLDAEQALAQEPELGGDSLDAPIGAHEQPRPAHVPVSHGLQRDARNHVAVVHDAHHRPALGVDRVRELVVAGARRAERHQVVRVRVREHGRRDHGERAPEGVAREYNVRRATGLQLREHVGVDGEVLQQRSVVRFDGLAVRRGQATQREPQADIDVRGARDSSERDRSDSSPPTFCERIARVVAERDHGLRIGHGVGDEARIVPHRLDVCVRAAGGRAGRERVVPGRSVVRAVVPSRARIRQKRPRGVHVVPRELAPRERGRNASLRHGCLAYAGQTRRDTCGSSDPEHARFTRRRLPDPSSTDHACRTFFVRCGMTMTQTGLSTLVLGALQRPSTKVSKGAMIMPATLTRGSTLDTRSRVHRNADDRRPPGSSGLVSRTSAVSFSFASPRASMDQPSIFLFNPSRCDTMTQTRSARREGGTLSPHELRRAGFIARRHEIHRGFRHTVAEIAYGNAFVGLKNRPFARTVLISRLTARLVEADFRTVTFDMSATLAPEMRPRGRQSNRVYGLRLVCRIGCTAIFHIQAQHAKFEPFMRSPGVLGKGTGERPATLDVSKLEKSSLLRMIDFMFGEGAADAVEKAPPVDDVDMACDRIAGWLGARADPPRPLTGRQLFDTLRISKTGPQTRYDCDHAALEAVLGYSPRDQGPVAYMPADPVLPEAPPSTTSKDDDLAQELADEAAQTLGAGAGTSLAPADATVTVPSWGARASRGRPPPPAIGDVPAPVDQAIGEGAAPDDANAGGAAPNSGADAVADGVFAAQTLVDEITELVGAADVPTSGVDALVFAMGVVEQAQTKHAGVSMGDIKSAIARLELDRSTQLEFANDDDDTLARKRDRIEHEIGRRARRKI